jgi:hypothetical protein
MTTHPKCKRCNDTGTVYESDGQGQQVPVACPDCEETRCPFCGNELTEFVSVEPEGLTDCLPYCPKCGETR